MQHYYGNGVQLSIGAEMVPYGDHVAALVTSFAASLGKCQVGMPVITNMLWYN